MKLFDWQREAVDGMAAQATPLRACLYFRTGAGKTLTALLGVRQAGYKAALVITPPSTYPQWHAQAEKLGLDIECISHAKFRMKDTKLSRTMSVIADEFHLFGGHKGAGWKKLDTLARHLQAPLVLASATPNYNDAERVYCIKHILDPHGTKGGYLQFLYTECNTKQNPFGMEPLVDDDRPFRNYADAPHFLSSLPGVYYLPDDVVYQIEEIPQSVCIDPAFETYGYDRYTHRIMASGIETKHRVIFNHFVDQNGWLNDEVYDDLLGLIHPAKGSVLVFANHSTVATACARSMLSDGVTCALITGDTSAKRKQEYLDAFRAGEIDVLVGTASLATGTDGLDKVCDTLIILDDTEDDALRRQVIGRILPRGLDTDATGKTVYRLLLS